MKKKGLYSLQVRMSSGMERTRIVTQFANAAVGQLVVVAPEGSCLAGQIVKRAKVSGEWSEAVLCGPSELGLDGDASQCVVLDKSHAPGDEAPPDLRTAESMLGTFAVSAIAMSGDNLVTIEGLLPDDSLKYLRSQLADKLQVSSQRMHLQFGSCMLEASDDSRSLKHLGIEHSAEVLVVISSFDPSKLKLDKPSNDNYCFHEGSYGHNPEGATTTALMYGDTCLWRKSSYWEYMVGDRHGRGPTPTGGEGENHQASLSDDKLTLTVVTEDLDTGKKVTDVFSVSELFSKRGFPEE